jgi:hypothetical protein
VHRPPRLPADRTPHCEWTVTIDPSHPTVAEPRPATVIARSQAALFADVSPIDPADDGDADYSGPLLADVRFADFSRSALVRIAEEVCLQMHLLVLSFRLAVGSRVDEATALDITRKGCTGIAGLTAARIKDALNLTADERGAAALLAAHPIANPRGYCGIDVEHGERLRLRLRRDTAAVADGAWTALVDPEHLEPVDAILQAVDPHLRAVVVRDEDEALTLDVVRDEAPHDELPEVALTRFSTGAAFRFADRGERRALPLIG